MKRMRQKYVRPTSITWLAGFVPMAAGVFIALEPVHQLANWVLAIQQMAGDKTPADLIAWGVALIGLRGAIYDMQTRRGDPQ